MKSVVKILLALSALMLAYFCVMSVMTPIKFEQEKTKRDKEVVTALMNIRKAQLEYKNENGKYAENFDVLIEYIKNGKIKQVMKKGTLTDDQLKAGLTELKALAIVKKGNAKEIAENGLTGFVRDTSYVVVLDTLFREVYDENTINDIRFIPYGNGVEFEMGTSMIEKNGIEIPLLEVKASYEIYLKDLDRQELVNLLDVLEQLEEQIGLEKYPGLKIGSLTESNNNAGNWEF